MSKSSVEIMFNLLYLHLIGTQYSINVLVTIKYSLGNGQQPKGQCEKLACWLGRPVYNSVISLSGQKIQQRKIVGKVSKLVNSEETSARFGRDVRDVFLRGKTVDLKAISSLTLAI